MRILSLVLFYAVLTASPHGFPGISAEKEYPGFEEIGNGRFYFEKERETNFVIARSSCRRKGAQLAEFEDDKEFQAVMAKAASGSSYWIGIAENKNALLQLQDDLKLLKKYPGFEKFGYGLFHIEQMKNVVQMKNI
ncbi:uncharacterized protein LOC6730826 [Drosophila simulans]|uniref:GD23211 n=1 Tax=Drosophila simulans TaxID=7240 RepID=B4Q939_DROSI|nr:uncharacterized protein LOC6730826 [Drosophila simulans]EDX03578.1 GD23211 [Drosophila simulans]KMY87825.1 uncharacterized protein Dsimw501_GD23211 [Drosophila simulans]